MTSQAQQSLKGVKILLVESQADQKKNFLDLAKPAGCLVFVCEGSIEAIQWIKKNGAPRLLIIEENASPMNGIQTSDFIQLELKLSLPVLISVNKDPASTYHEKDLLGFTGKPFSEQTILLIKSFLEKQEVSTNLNQNTYSLNYLRNIYDENEDFIIASVHLFSDSVSVKLTEITKALANNEFKVVRDIAHNIKPSFEMLENNAGKDLCDTIVHKASDQEISALAEKLNQVFADIDSQLKKDFPKRTEV